jgi:endonuclease-3 related protein
MCEAPASPSMVRFQWLQEQLFDAYGRQHWWPADTPFEVMVGAVLTQNTAWPNVEKAIENLKRQGMLCPRAMMASAAQQVAALIRPAGYFNVKAQRLQNLCRFVLQNGGVEALAGLTTNALRRGLLAVNGVGPETADDILLYAFGRPVFVVDAYTRRIGQRIGLLRGDESYEAIRAAFETALPSDADLLNELHALIVRHAKEHCRKRPLCQGCCLRSQCLAPSMD